MAKKCQIRGQKQAIVQFVEKSLDIFWDIRHTVQVVILRGTTKILLEVESWVLLH